MNLNAEQQALLARVYETAIAFMTGAPEVLGPLRELEQHGVKLCCMNLQLHLVGVEAGPVSVALEDAAKADLEFLSQLRIVPDISVGHAVGSANEEEKT